MASRRPSRKPIRLLLFAAISVSTGTLVAGCAPSYPYPPTSDDETSKYEQLMSEMSPLETFVTDLDREADALTEEIAQINPELKLRFPSEFTSSGPCERPFERTAGQQFGGREARVDKAPASEDWSAIAAKVHRIGKNLSMNDITDKIYGNPGPNRMQLVYATGTGGGLELLTTHRQTTLTIKTGCRYTNGRTADPVTAVPGPRLTHPETPPTR